LTSNGVLIVQTRGNSNGHHLPLHCPRFLCFVVWTDQHLRGAYAGGRAPACGGGARVNTLYVVGAAVSALLLVYLLVALLKPEKFS
jgi:K+-transporting ATPase KdpF subunit